MRCTEAGIKGVLVRRPRLHEQMLDGWALDLWVALGGMRGARTHDELVDEAGGISALHALLVGARMAALAGGVQVGET
jgi:hypothetical protein